MNPLESAIQTGAALQKSAPKLTELKKSTQALEANFVKTLLQTMRKSVQEVHVGDGTGGDTYRDMMDDAIANSFAQRGDLGIGKIAYKSVANKVIKEALGSRS